MNIDKFWSLVDKSGDCWIWKGVTNRGYGMFYLDGTKERRTHRLSYMLCVGPIPEGQWVLHKCDNPPCCNPDHLFAGTRSDNMRDCAQKGRHYYQVNPVLFCKRGHKLEGENRGHDHRSPRWTFCLICKRERDAARYGQHND